MKNSRRMKALLSMLIVFSLLFGTFTTFAASNMDVNTDLKSAKEGLKEISREKIHQDLHQQLSEEGYGEALVYLKDRVEPEAVAKANLNGRTPYEQELSSRKALISALKDKAETTQYDLIKYLEQEKENGNVSEIESFHIVNMVYVKGSKDVIENLSYMNEVEKIYPNRFIEIDKPEKIDSKNTIASTEGLEWNIERVGAELVWNLGYDGSGVVIGLIDTGADWTHEALREKWRGYDPNNPSNPNPVGNWFDAIAGRELPYDIPSVPHGSHCLGTILGQDPAGENKIGVAPGAQWIAAKAFTESGGYDRDLLASGEWMLAPGGDPSMTPDVINNSWGGGSGLDEWYRDMVRSWRAANILPVFAAGNERGRPAPPASISSPANYPECFAVGATDRNNIRADFSQRGPSPYGDIIKPEISAPGVGIRSSVPGGYEGGWSGTSMATPHIVGTTALLLSANNSLTIDEIEMIIEETATSLTDNDYPEAPNYGYGYGLVNAFDAVSQISIGTGTITGQVLIDGEDMDAPQIIHEPITECFSGSDMPIEARIIDDISILEAKLLVKNENMTEWEMLDMKLKSGDIKDGIYGATIPHSMIVESGFIYKLQVKDFADNLIESPEYNVSVVFGIVPDQYETDFESYPIGWTLTEDWEWGEPVGEPAPYNGTKVLGTNLSGNYSNSSNSLLVTPPMDLRDENLPSATLRLFHWYETENRYDKGQVYVTNDYGETWIPVGPEYTGDGKAWNEIIVNLGEYIGSQDPVFVGFRLTSDGSVNKLGWYIDDLRLVGLDTEAPSIPTELTAEARIAGVSLNWTPSPEGDVAGYKVYRSEVSGGEYTLIGEANTPLYIDNTVEANTTYYYVVTAYDFAGNETGYSDEVEVGVGQIDIIFFTNFEENDGGFTTDAVEGKVNCWEHGIPTSGPGEALTGTKVWATDLDANYPNNSNCWIESPEIAIPAEGNPMLSFNHWYETEATRWDPCQVHVAGEDGVWTNITPGESFGGRDNTVWTTTEIPLDNYKGQNIKLRFVFVSDTSVNYQGWYIDNVAVANLTEPAKLEIIEKTVEEYHKPEKDYVEPEELEFNLKANTLSMNNYETTTAQNIGLTGIPVDAVVTVVETGRSVRTDLKRGTYGLKHAANEEGETWTIRAAAYGYYPQEFSVHLEDEATLIQNFFLDPMPRGDIAGRITDKTSGEGIANAYIRVVEDLTVEPVYTDEEGNFTMPSVLEGTYTIKITADGYVAGETTVEVVGDQTNVIEVALKRFVGYEEEIIYDDGTAENALVLNGANNGLAVKITPSEYGKVKATNIFFWGTDWPSPGGNEIGITIFDTDANGNPTQMVGQPKYVTVTRGAWNLIDLSDFGFTTDRDFFIATMQNQIGDNSPGTGIDESSPHAERSYLHLGGEEFTPLAQEGVQGGLMIRALMEYSLDTPEITNLEEINYTNQDMITVEGKVTADGTVNVYVNDEKAAEVESENREFVAEINLPVDENIITVSATMDGKETEPSDPISVIKDKVEPELNLITPVDGEKVNKEVVHVTGNVADEHFDKLLINNKEIEIDEEGNFHERVMVNSGENTITVVASDLAGNEKTVERTVYANLEGPVITDIKPDVDLTVKAGDQVEISFRSEVIGGKGYFRILLPMDLTNADGTKVEMVEVEEGYYKALWTVPENVLVNDAVVEIEFTDLFGNTIMENAPGRITVEESAEPEIPVLSNILPDKNQNIKTGEMLEVSFTTASGGTGYFEILSDQDEIIVDMAEVEEGLYKGQWIAPEGLEIKEGRIKVLFISEDDIEVEEILSIKLKIKNK